MPKQQLTKKNGAKCKNAMALVDKAVTDAFPDADDVWMTDPYLDESGAIIKCVEVAVGDIVFQVVMCAKQARS